MPQPRPSFWQRLRLSFWGAPDVTSEQLADANPTRRWRSVRALAASPRPALLPDLMRLLADPDVLVRDETARTLASWGADYSLAPARELLAGEPSPELAVSALDLLALLEDPGAQPLATPYLTAADPLTRAAAARAIGSAGPSLADSDVTASALLPLVSDPDARVRRLACLALGRIGAAVALPALLAALQDSDLSTRQFSRQAITRIETEVARRRKESERMTARQATMPPSSKRSNTGTPLVEGAQAESHQDDIASDASNGAPPGPSAPAP